ADVDCDAPGLVVDQFALARMQPRANLQAKLAETVSDRAGAANPPRGAVERREEAVASRVHLPTTEPRELAADDLVVFLEEFPPGPVAEAGSTGSRIDHIGEQDGREHRFGSATSSPPSRTFARNASSSLKSRSWSPTSGSKL